MPPRPAEQRRRIRKGSEAAPAPSKVSNVERLREDLFGPNNEGEALPPVMQYRLVLRPTESIPCEIASLFVCRPQNSIYWEHERSIAC